MLKWLFIFILMVWVAHLQDKVTQLQQRSPCGHTVAVAAAGVPYERLTLVCAP